MRPRAEVIRSGENRQNVDRTLSRDDGLQSSGSGSKDKRPKNEISKRVVNSTDHWRSYSKDDVGRGR